MGVRNRLNVLFEYTAYSRFLVVILGLLQNTIATAIAEDYLEGAIDGDEYLKKIINGEKKPAKPGVILFTAPYKLCKGPACGDPDFVMAFPLFVGKKGKDVYKKLYARDHSVIHSGKPNAPFKQPTTKATTTTTTTEVPLSAPQCMNMNVDLEFVTRTNEEKETVTCPTFPPTTTTEEKPTTEEATTKELTTEEPTTEEPTTEEPTTEEPTTEKPTTEKPTSTESTTEEPTTTVFTTTEPSTIVPTTEELTTNQPSTEAITITTEVTTTEVSIEQAVQQNEEITTTACPTAPPCEEEETTMTCPTVTGCIKRKRLRHTLPLKSTTSSRNFFRQHTANTKNKLVVNSPEEMWYGDEVTGPQTTTLRQFLRNNYASRATTPIHTFTDYYYYYYLLK